MGESEPPAPAPSNASTRVLVVEDEVLARMMIADYLRDCGYCVYEAENAEDARMVLDAQTPIDIVFTDVQLTGGEDGFSLARWARGRYPGTGVILTSGRVGEAATCADLHELEPPLTKPYGPEEVRLRIEFLLRRASPSHN
jgi:DNA-binding response OmpR family regulator